MPKMKSHSGASKRLKRLKSGKVKLYSSGRRHMLTKRDRKLKRNMRQAHYVGPSDIGRCHILLPYVN